MLVSELRRPTAAVLVASPSVLLLSIGTTNSAASADGIFAID
jgi:hypothetical protein